MKAQKLIITLLEKGILMHIINCSDAKSMYDRLCMIFEKDNEQLKYTLMQEFFNYKFNKSLDIVNNVSWLENIAYKLKSMDHVIYQRVMTCYVEDFGNAAWKI